MEVYQRAICRPWMQQFSIIGTWSPSSSRAEAGGHEYLRATVCRWLYCLMIIHPKIECYSCPRAGCFTLLDLATFLMRCSWGNDSVHVGVSKVDSGDECPLLSDWVAFYLSQARYICYLALQRSLNEPLSMPNGDLTNCWNQLLYMQTSFQATVCMLVTHDRVFLLGPMP